MVHQCTFMNFCTYLSDQASQSRLYVSSMYCKVVSSNTSRFKAHAGFFRLLVKGVFDPYVPVMYCFLLTKSSFHNK